MTIKQQKAIENLVGNGGNVTQAMIDAGYSPATANTPQKLTESKGFEELREKYLPDSEVLEVHKKALEANKIISSHTEPDYEYPDHAIRLKAAELAYKVTGRLKNDMNVAGDVIFNVKIERNA